MKEFSSMSLEELIQVQGHNCSCGRYHKAGLRCLRIGTGAVEALPDFLAQTGVTRPFIISDPNTRGAAWHLVEPVMDTAGIPYSEYVYAGAHVEPDEQALGSLVMAFDPRCDGILAMGSGVLNDLAKVFAHALRLPSLVVATAPSMDGYASDSAAMIRERVKVSLYNACPQAIIADTRILREAPERLLQAGLDFLQPGAKAAAVALIEGRKAADDAAVAAGQHQLRVGDQEHRRRHYGQA